MQRPMDRRRFLVRAASAVGGVAAAVSLRPRTSHARELSDGITPFSPIAPRSPDLNWYALDPEWGAGDPGCPADPVSAHLSTHNCHACTACHSHAENKLFANAAAANLHRAHTGCHCEVVIGGALPDDIWMQLFGDPQDLEFDNVDRRWDWVQEILGGDQIECVSDGLEVGDPAFANTWRRTDKPVLEGNVARTWMWGPQPYSCAFYEPYVEAPGGQRLVQYYDKSRMEITDPSADSNSIWYVTNGLLVQELISGKRQLGNNSFESHTPAAVNVAGDSDDPDGPTYASFAGQLHFTPGSQESAITRVIHRNGSVTSDGTYASYGIGAAHFVDETQHWIAEPFWEFMNSSGLVYNGASLTNAPLFENPYYATGFPVTEAFWAIVKVANTPRAVLMQCFERRCLTFTPGNPTGFVTEAGNVGQHYYFWRHA